MARAAKIQVAQVAAPNDDEENKTMKEDVKKHVPHGSRPYSEDEAARPGRDRRPVTEQAAGDIAGGQRDMDLHGATSNVSDPGTQPDRPEGADVSRQDGRREVYPKYPRSRVRAPALRRRKR